MSTTLQHSPADIVRQLLVDDGMGTDPEDNAGWPVFATSEPDQPDNVVTIYDTSAVDDGRVMQGQIQEHKGLQVRVRATDHNTGYRKINAIRVFLSETAYQEVVTLDAIQYRITCFSRIGGIIALGKNVPNAKHSLFTLNFTAPIDQLTSNTVS